MKSLVYGTFLLAFVMGTATAWTAPEPAIVQKSGLWTATAIFEPLQQIRYQASPSVQPKRFWYSILTISNNTQQDMEFYPRCDLMTDTFQLLPAYEKIPKPIYDLIRKRHQTKYPLLQAMSSVGNRLLQGEDHAKEVLVVWPDFDPQARFVSLFITGLSNETAAVEHPVLKDANGKPSLFFLRKTLQLDYKLQSEAPLRSNADIKFAGKTWVMR